MRSTADFERVQSAAALGCSDYEIARRTGIPRATVQNWRRRDAPPRGLAQPIAARWRPPDGPTYAYLLGMYLGDGNIWRAGAASWRLCITLDATYPDIIQRAISAVRDTGKVTVRVNAKPGAKVVLASSPIWTLAFPQHGPGRKHERLIELERWQAAITRTCPRQLLRGLIDSDGCRTMNRFSTRLPSGRIGHYAYPRYFFTNASADIRGIFCRHCELLGIRWTQSNARNISISHRRSVALLDEFVGPKR